MLGEPVVADEHVMLASEVENLEFDYFSMFRPFGVNNRHLDFKVVLDPLVDGVVCIVDGSSCSIRLGVEFVGSNA